jgi:hypothetical protein
VKNFFKILLIFEEGMCYNQSRGKERDVPNKTNRYGALAQLGERYTGSVEVSGSNPLCSTIKRTPEPLRNQGFFAVPKKLPVLLLDEMSRKTWLLKQ